MASTHHKALLRSYTDQPDALPAALREEWQRRHPGETLQLYALSDLDADHRLREAWLILGPGDLTLVLGAAWQTVDRAAVRKVEETAGLSGSLYRIRSGESDAPPLLEVRFSRRQLRTMENIRVLLESDRHESLAADADTIYLDSVTEPIRNAQSVVRGSEMAVIWRLLGYLRPYKRDVWIGGLAAVCLTLLALIPPRVAGLLIDGIAAGPEYRGPNLWTYVVVMAAAFLFREFFLWIRLRRMAMMGERVAHDLRSQIYSHVQTLSLRFFTRTQSGSIIARCSSDTDRLWDFIAFGVIEVALSVLMLLGLGTILVWMDWRLGLIMTLPVPLFLLAFYLNSQRMQHIFQKAWRKWSDLTSVLSGTIPGIRVVKAFNQETREIARFNRQNAQCLDTFQSVHRVWTSFWPVLMLSFHAVTLTVWIFALRRLTGDAGPALSVGTFTAFLLYTGMFLHPLEVIGQMTRMMNRAVSSAHRIFEILDTEPQIQNIPEPIVLPKIEGAISFDRVGFSYDGIRPVIKDVSFRIEPGEMIGLVGPSGAGKSTLMNLLARFYDASSGEIRVDGVDIRHLELGAYRRSLGMVLQEPYLFHGTLLENISYGIEHASRDAIISAAQAAHAHEFICGFEHGYETMVGERGQTLSGGERQRISIARAILHNPRILILDEATSNVDTETERKIQDALDRLVEGRTVLAIAHRLSTLKRANRLLVLKDGALVESGTHAELLNKPDGVFRKLHELQRELHEQFAV